MGGADLTTGRKKIVIVTIPAHHELVSASTIEESLRPLETAATPRRLTAVVAWCTTALRSSTCLNRGLGVILTIIDFARRHAALSSAKAVPSD